MVESIIGSNWQKLARWLLEHEVSLDDSPGGQSAIIRVSEKLRHPLTTLAGSVGFHALQARALTLSKIQSSSLNRVQVNLNGSLEGLDYVSDPEAMQEGMVLVGTLLELLSAFIGEELVFRLLLSIWSELPEEAELWEGRR